MQFVFGNELNRTMHLSEIEKIWDDKNNILAIIVPSDYKSPGINFFTPGDYSQQLAFMNHPKKKQILPHVHNPVPREVTYTQEVLFIRNGKIRIDFYNDNKEYLQSHVLKSGDVVQLIAGGHGFEVIEEVDMIEVKQGPYVGEKDKTRITGVTPDKIIIHE